MRRSFFLSVGLVDLLLSYLLFSSQQYFSLAAMLGILLLIAIGFATIMLSYYYQRGKNDRRYLIKLALLSLISVVLIIYEVGYGARYATVSSSTVSGVIIAVAATLVFVVGLQLAYVAEKYLEKRSALNRSRYLSYALIAAFLIVLSIVLYLFQGYLIHVTNWVGTDELAFNYYASTLFLHGGNPYVQSMQPALKTYGLDATLLMNGTCECSYDYPALSFVLPAALTIGKYPNSFVLGTMILAAFVSFVLYRNSKWDRRALLPIAVWFLAAFYITPASLDKYIAVSLFLLLAYLYRSKIALSGACMGLAAATSQLSWVALPFFYVMALRSLSKGAALRSVLITAVVFLLANGYFIALSPSKTVGNMVSLLLDKLQFSGPSLGQFLVAFFPTPYWAPTLIAMTVLVILLLLFYAYTDTLWPLLAIAPIMVSFVSWRSLPSYTAAFIPLIIAAYYTEKGGVKDLVPSKNAIAYALVLLALISGIVVVYAHGTYLGSNTLRITSVNAYVARSNATGAYFVSKILVNVSNGGRAPEQVLFFLVSRSPNTAKYTPVTTTNSIPVNSSAAYLLPVSLPSFNATTKLYVFALSNDYMKGVRVNSTSGG